MIQENEVKTLSKPLALLNTIETQVLSNQNGTQNWTRFCEAVHELYDVCNQQPNTPAANVARRKLWEIRSSVPLESRPGLGEVSLTAMMKIDESKTPEEKNILTPGVFYHFCNRIRERA